MFISLKKTFAQDLVNTSGPAQTWFENNMPPEWRDYDSPEVVRDLCRMWLRDNNSTKILIPAFEEVLDELANAYWDEREYLDSLVKQHVWND